LVLVHGFATPGKFQWFKQVDDLSKHYRLIIVNLLYFGSMPKTSDYTIDGQVQSVKSLMEKLQISSFHLCGASYGGLVAAEFTLQYPEKVNKLILMDTPLKFLTEEDIKNTCLKYDVNNEIELFVPSDPLSFKRLMSISYVKEPKMTMPMIKSFYKQTYEKNINDLRNIYKSLKNENKTFVAKNYHFKIPVLLIWGKEDELVPLHVGQELKTHIGDNARFEIVPGAAHLPNLENKYAVNKLMISFLN
jgi:pimeloyl-ACP methyl ester carboxylesterase